MGFGNKLKRIAAYGVKPKTIRRIRQKLGLSGKKIKKMLGLSAVASPVATSAYTEGYHHQGRSLSQLTGGA